MSGPLDHLSNDPREITAGPSVPFWESVQQSITQQYEVDSELALTDAVNEQWQEQIEALELKTGQSFRHAPLTSAYYAYIDQLQSGAEEPRLPGALTNTAVPQTVERIAAADRAIQELGDPDLKTFNQVLQDVYARQHEVEGRTAEYDERGGSFVGSLLGAVIGSFSLRDPLNVTTLPVGGVGRSVATKIGTEMLAGSAIAAVTEYGSILPNRERAGLPERSPVFDIVAAGLGAGALRGLFEGAGAGFRRLGRATGEFDLDVRDTELRQMFENNANSPRARAGLQALDEVAFVERNNPYGEGQAANVRFLAELADVGKTMAGEPQTAIARFLPPIEFEKLSQIADFSMVRDQAPEVWAKLEAAEVQLRAVQSNISEIDTAINETTLADAVRLVDPEAGARLDELAEAINAPDVSEPLRARIDMETRAIVERTGEDKIAKALNDSEISARKKLQHMRRASWPAANRRYKEAYKAVEAESARIKDAQQKLINAQQKQALDVYGSATPLKPFIAPQLSYDYAAATVERINLLNDQLADHALAVSRALPDADDTFDIGLQDRVPGTFRFPTEDGHMSVADAMDDLREDELLEEAAKGCSV